MKTILIFVSALALTSAPMIHGQAVDPRIQAELDQVQNNQAVDVSEEDFSLDLAPQGISVAMKSSTSTTAHTTTRGVSRGRYGAPQGYAPMSVFKGRRPYTGPECLEGLGHKTARELGWEGRRVYNEMLHKAEIVTLSGDAVIYYDTGSMQPVYLEGCFRRGKPYKNMIAFVDQPVVHAPPPQREVEVKKEILYVPAPRPQVDCVLVKIHDCYGRVVRVIKMTRAEFAQYQQTQNSQRSYAGGQMGQMPRGNSNGGGNAFLGIVAQIGQITIGSGHGGQHRPPSGPRPRNHW